jgi:UDP-N-acetylmuramate dehydrogenase
MSLRDDLRAIADVREQEPMARHTTFGIGGPADYYVVAATRAELTRATLATREADAALLVLGSGSNILVGDGGVRGVVLENQASAVHDPIGGDGEILLTSESGMPFAALTRHVARLGLRGLEWAAGIPGTMGGAVVYNAGAYGGCLADVLRGVTLLQPDGREEAVALDLTFALQPGDADAALARIAELETRRKASAPRGRNAGSTFKNPEAHPVWWLIDQVGLRGHRIGDAQVSEKHTNYFSNMGAARAADVAALIDLARTRVRDAFGIELETEVSYVGEGFA